MSVFEILDNIYFSEVPLPTNTNATEDMKNSTKKGVNITVS